MNYINTTTHETWFEGHSITRILSDGSVFSGIPTVEQLELWGFVEEEIIENLLDPLELAKKDVLFFINEYDNSSNVNSFTIGDLEMWLDAQTRQQLRTSVESYIALGLNLITKWFNGQQFTFNSDLWLLMLNALEVYASEALNVTEYHRATVKSLQTVDEVNNYDYTTMYPEKLHFG